MRDAEDFSDDDEITADDTQVVEGTSVKNMSLVSPMITMIGSDSVAARMMLGRKRIITILPRELTLFAICDSTWICTT